MKCDDHKALLDTGTEPQITERLQTELISLLNSGCVAGYSPSAYGWPIRGQEIDDHTGKHLENRPDLTFPRLSARPASNHNALFYECKILGRGRTVKDYVERGVMRFQEGLYAWAMPQAGMIAYLCASGAIDAQRTLIDAWSETPGPAAPYAPIGEVLREAEGAAPPVAISRHARGFPLRNGMAPGHITLRHLWLGQPNSECPTQDDSSKVVPPTCGRNG